MKRLISISVLLLLFVSTMTIGQNDFQNQFYTFREKICKQYGNYRDSINNAFAKHLEKSWNRFNINSPLPVPQKPIPQMDIFISGVNSDVSSELAIDSVIQQKDSSDELSLWDASGANRENVQSVTVHYFGSELRFHYYPEYTFSIKTVEEKTIASIWKQLSESPYAELINELLFYRNDMNLNDWGMYQLLNLIVAEFFPDRKNEQILFSAFVMNQLGFRMKIGKCEKQLLSLVSSQTPIYGIPFINLGNEKYYLFEQTNTQSGIYSYQIDYPTADKNISLQAKRPFRLALSLYTRQCTVENNTYSINLNRNLIDLFQTYPQTEISVYANTPISSITRKSLEKELLPQLMNKTEWESVNFLLQFVQTAFEYKNDIQQFGQEKFFFSEELFFYPFSDCEDRSVLFSQLVRRFLGLQVILLDYPDHVATAVKFNSPIEGDFINVQGERYIICDPTYLHAKVGQSIPRYKKQRAKIYILD